MKTSLPQVARIQSTVDESPRVRTLTLDLDLEAEPGQFVMAWRPGVDEKPLSLARTRPVTLTIARVGPFSAAIHDLGPGDRLWIRGPLGTPFALGDRTISDGALLLIGGGYGVAPLHFLSEGATAKGWKINTIIGARTKEDVIFADRFRAQGAQVTVSTDDGSLGQQGLATDAAAHLLDQGNFQAVFACGPEPMLRAVEGLARERQLPAQLSYERYMRCGFGVCGSCAESGWLVCRDGPVKHFVWE